MNNQKNKPKKQAQELVSKLEAEGVLFHLTTKEMAEIYFLEKNNYLRVAVYRQLFEKHENGKNGQAGKYINLEFAYLTELSRVDMNLRSIFLKMCIDIEHTLKVKLISDIEANEKENGYDIVDIFLRKHEILKSIGHKGNSNYVGKLIHNYFIFSNNGIVASDCPAWVFVEILEFNHLIKFLFCYNEQYKMKKRGRLKIPNENILHSVRQLRNACAHNNCILYGLRSNPPAKKSTNKTDKSKTSASQALDRYISQIDGISKEVKDRRLSSQSMLEIVSLLYTYEQVVPNNMKLRRYEELKYFVHNEMKQNSCYNNNEIVKSSFNFLEKVVDNLKVQC